MRYLLFLLLIGFQSHAACAQSGDTLKRALTIDFEVRPRAEFRNNFMLTPADSTMPELYVSQRNRFTINYTSKKLKFHVSPQEIHVWGKSGKFSHLGSINAFEFYIEPSLTKHFSVRIGRQAISLDNGRLFSAAPWSQQSRTHEGIRLFYGKKITTDLTIAFTRPYGKRFDVSYSPVAAHQYKWLFVHHLKYKFKNPLTVTTINTLEVFENNHEYYQRITNGGRLEYNRQWLYATVNAYYQYGQNTIAKTISAYYIQPEVSASFSKTTLRLGAEILSGNKTSGAAYKSSSFVPLYGVAWKFMGNMNLFTRFPADVNDSGLINPYLFLIYQVSNKLSFRADTHLFYAQHALSSDQSTGRYLGFENDFSMNFKPVKKVEIILGFSSAVTEKSMELLKKIPDSNKIPVWSYLMISYTPRLLHLKSKSVP